MKQADYIKQIAKFALANDNARLRDLLYQYVEYSQQNNRGKFATEILSIIKDSDRENSLGKLKEYRLNKHFDYKADEYILQTVTSSFTMKDCLDLKFTNLLFVNHGEGNLCLHSTRRYWVSGCIPTLSLGVCYAVVQVTCAGSCIDICFLSVVSLVNFDLVGCGVTVV